MEENIDKEMSKVQCLPHYMMPSFASVLPEYTNTEAEQIRQAFSTGNFQSIIKIPNKIGPENLLKARQSMIEENLQRSTNLLNKDAPKIITKNGIFSQFEYIPSNYSSVSDAMHMDRLKSDAKRLEIGGKNFICTSHAKKLKYEDYPYMSGLNDPYEDEMIKKKIDDAKKILYGPFIPTGNNSNIGTVGFNGLTTGGINGKENDTLTRKLTPDIIKEINDVISTDWEDVAFHVSTTEDENFMISFDLDTVESEKGLATYMNVFANNHILTEKYNLHKIIEEWNVKTMNGKIYYQFRPPWTKPKSKIHFSSLQLNIKKK